MMHCFIRFGLGLFGSVLVTSAGLSGADVELDFSQPESYTQTIEVSGEPGWSITGEAVYDPVDQSLRVAGIYRSEQAIEIDSSLSYRILDEFGEILDGDGARYAWIRESRGNMASRFDLVIPQVSEDPRRTNWIVEFNVVKEGEYWYRDQFPEIDFAKIAFVGLPSRDHYVAGAAWVPRFLPAEIPARIPAWIQVGLRDEKHSGFRPSLDIVTPDLLTKVPSARLEFPSNTEGTFWGWMPLGGQAEGSLLIRPGMVWEQVRWYEAPDWFERKVVQFVSPVHYLLVAVLIGGLGLWSWLNLSRIPSRAARWMAGVVLGGGTLYWIGNLMISGFFPAILAPLLAWIVARSRWLPSRAHAYLLAWLFMVWIEVYWGRIDGVAGMKGSALVFSAATWAVLVLPLLTIRSAGWRYGVTLAVTLGWWFATVLGVAYYEFFQDFPSVGDLFYAAQITQLGDSVSTLLGPRHWLPLWVWALMAGAALGGTRFSEKPRSKKRNT